MNGIAKTIGIFLVGMIAGSYVLQKDIEKGDVVYEDDDKYVKASKNKSMGYSLARVHWKNPIKK